LKLAIYDNTTKSFAYNYQSYTQSQLLSSSFILNAQDNYSIYAVYYIPVNITTKMFENNFKFAQINYGAVPYNLTNSTSNIQDVYHSGINSYTETFFISPPNDQTIYGY